MAVLDNTTTLVADIGGTNTRVSLVRDGALLENTVSRYSNAEFQGLAQVLKQYLTDQGNVDPAAACVAVAGPVYNNVATMTNLDWQIDAKTVATATKAETVAILNDLQAQGHAIGHLKKDAYTSVLKGKSSAKDAAKMVIGVGTGFNIAPVLQLENTRVVTPSEAGHTSLPVHTQPDFELAHFVGKRHGFASVEDVLSGRGIERVYAWHSGAEIGAHKAQNIMQAHAEGSDLAAQATVQTCVRYLGIVAGDLALSQLPFGGLYLVGGVARALAPFFDTYGFADAFVDKGRFGEFMSNFSVQVVTDDYAALLGSAVYIAQENA
jgi:glucokinase